LVVSKANSESANLARSCTAVGKRSALVGAATAAPARRATSAETAAALVADDRAIVWMGNEERWRREDEQGGGKGEKGGGIGKQGRGGKREGERCAPVKSVGVCERWG